MNEQNQLIQKDSLLDISGLRTGFPITKKFLIVVAAAIVAFLVITFAVDLSAYGEQASLGLGAFVAVLIVMIFGGIDIFEASLIMVFFGLALGVFEWGDVTSALGSSSFYTLLGMTIVAGGAEFTPFGKRFAYSFLKWFGQKPIPLVIAFTAATAILSAFVSNTAVIILMSGICSTLLSAMGEKPGESKIGRVLMSLVVMASFFGGCCLISGSPYGNSLMISFLESGSSGAYTVTYAQWAIYGTVSFLVLLIPICFIYIKFNKFKSSDVQTLPKEYYQKKLDELGPMGGSEYRWCAMIVIMVILMIMGKNTAMMAMLFAMLCLIPGFGVSPMKGYEKKIPLSCLLCIALVPMMALFITKTGLIDWISDIIIPILDSVKSPLLYAMICALIMGLGVNFTVSAMTAFQAAYMVILVPITVELGFNPVVVLMPTLLIASFFWSMGLNYMVMLNRGYGYWEDKDLFAPGMISVVLCAIVIPLLVFAISGILGVSPIA